MSANPNAREEERPERLELLDRLELLFYRELHLKEKLDKLDRIMASQTEVVTQLGAISASVKIIADGIKALQTSGGPASPELVAAVTTLASDVKAVSDALTPVPPAPLPGT